MQTDVSRQRTPVSVDSFNAPQRSGGVSGAAVVLPLRLFLGISFVAAGIDKLTDPEFFNPSAFNYIGNQLTGFAGQSPIGGFLRDFAVPNATLFGWLTVLGELAIGIATLAGLLTRTSAFFGLVLSLTLWLTATWTVTPFFLGSDLPYALGWLTLLIAGAHPVLSLDGQIAKWRANRRAAATMVEGSPADSGLPVADRPMMAATVETPEHRAALARRRFIMVAGGTAVAGALSGVAWYNSLANKKSATAAANPAPSATATPAPASTVAPETSSATTAPVTSATTAASSTTTAPATSATTVAPVATTAPAATSPTTVAPVVAAPAGDILEKLANIPAGSAKLFKTPDTNEPAILVHNTDGVVTAFSSVCTHQGCDVAFNAAANALACPCHGAQFDPKTGEATRRPANRALKSFKVQVDASGNIVYLKA